MLSSALLPDLAPVCDGISLTHQRPLPPLAHLPSSLPIPACRPSSPGAVLILEAWSHFLPGTNKSWEGPDKLCPDPFLPQHTESSRHESKVWEQSLTLKGTTASGRLLV